MKQYTKKIKIMYITKNVLSTLTGTIAVVFTLLSTNIVSKDNSSIWIIVMGLVGFVIVLSLSIVFGGMDGKDVADLEKKKEAKRNTVGS